jgi:arabinose-5-phosphate isomerase
MDSIINYSISMLEMYKNELQKLEQVIKTQSDFIKIINLITHKKGKLIFTAVGKSGHIAKKASATFASLGISSFFIHSTEASHGDIGMIDDNDILFAISNSGETSELKDIVITCKNKKIPVISISKTKDSFLGQNSDLFLQIKCSEAMPNIPAPTCSTTIVLTILDIIACCIANNKQFSIKDYAVNHPGGKLGELARKEFKI